MAIMYLLYWLFIYSGRENSHNEIWAFKAKFDLKGQGQSFSKTIEILTKVFWASGDPSLNRWWVMVETISKWGKFWFLG